jgi:hypothetical protein
VSPPVSLRRVATSRLPTFSGYSLSILDERGESLNERASRLLVPVGPHPTREYWDEGDVRYCALAMLYHLNRIVDRYVVQCRLFESQEHLRDSIRGNVHDAQVFYEVDALISCARRLYESLRKVLWRRYRPGEAVGRWRSIKGAIGDGGIPVEFSARLRESWDRFGVPLKDYRDCVAHVNHLTDGATTCWLEPIENRWRATVKLPSNPRSARDDFDFASGPDAMSYCYQVVCHLIELVEALGREPVILTALRR